MTKEGGVFVSRYYMVYDSYQKTIYTHFNTQACSFKNALQESADRYFKSDFDHCIEDLLLDSPLSMDEAQEEVLNNYTHQNPWDYLKEQGFEIIELTPKEYQAIETYQKGRLDPTKPCPLPSACLHYL